MANIIQKNEILAPTFNTLAQLSKNNLKKRARSKWYTQAVVGSLLYLDTPLKQYYRNAYYCNDSLVQYGQTFKSENHYCNTRVCNVCNRIRTAKLMNSYVNQLEKFDCLQFVTLTLPNIKDVDLLNTIEYMNKVWYQIKYVFKYKKQLLSGIRKLEITYNAITDTYHPHYHIIVNTAGAEIIQEWLKRIPFANIKGQDCRQADKNSLKEIFKYTTKIIDRKKNDLIVYTNGLNTIMVALKGKRSIQTFGIVKQVNEDIDEKELNAQVYDVPEYDFMEWKWIKNDWVNKSKQALTGYIQPDVKFIYK